MCKRNVLTAMDRTYRCSVDALCASCTSIHVCCMVVSYNLRHSSAVAFAVARPRLHHVTCDARSASDIPNSSTLHHIIVTVIISNIAFLFVFPLLSSRTMATIQDRTFSHTYSGLKNQFAVAGVLAAACLTGYELMRRRRRGPGRSSKYGGELGSVETWEFG